MTRDVLLRRIGRAGRITLNRPRALNALTHAMTLAISGALDAWREDEAVALVVVDAAGERAFCAGGDLGKISAAGRRGDFDGPRRFWADEYRLNAKIARYPKPYVALAQGHVLGAGVGLASHGSHRIVGDSARVALPECGIGLVPDAGGTHLLARAPGRLGEFLGLGGHRMGPGEAIHAGFADAHVPEADWPSLVARLEGTGDAEGIAGFARAAPASTLKARQGEIDEAFSAPDLPTLIARLEVSDWGAGVAKGLMRQSPLSMACTLALVRAARAGPGLEAALIREYRFSARSLPDGDLLEGIRARVIDKDRRPLWRDGIDGVTEARVAAMLAPLPVDWPMRGA